MKNILNAQSLDLIFRNARTYYSWQEKSVSEMVLRAIYDLSKMGPTSANCSPMRLVFVSSPEGKDRLKPYLDPGNVEKTMAAPVTAIIGYDTQFYNHLPKLFPHTNAKAWFEGESKKAFTQETAFRNSSLQGAYLIIAARSLGLDCGPMSGFDKAGVDKEFFKDGLVKSNFLCNIGYGNPDGLHPRNPRLGFDEACEII